MVDRKHPDALCEECPLYSRPMVATSISRDVANGAPVDVMWVGEAPAGNEVVQGKGFVGDSGNLLWQTAKHAGLERNTRAAVTNSVLCRPKSKNPEHDELAACRPRLLKEISQYQPKIVVAMGNYALSAVTGSAMTQTKITKRRGRIEDIEIGSKTFRVVPTLHPASLLYNAGGFKDFSHDIETVRTIIDGTFTDVNENLPELELIDSMKDLEGLLTRMTHDEKFRADSRSEYAELEVAADLETGGFDYSEGGDEILCVSMSFDSVVGQVISEELVAESHGRKLLNEIFNHPKAHWTWQNGAFDSNFLVRDIGTFPMHHDTIPLHYATDERRGTHSLEQMSMEIEKAPDYKKMVDPYLKGNDGSYRNIPRDVLYLYAAYDAVYTRRLRFTLERIAKEQGKVPA